MVARQVFFNSDGEYQPRLKGLKENQKKVLSLLNAGLLQAGIAERLHKSRPYINQITKSLESLGLIQRRKPTYFYDLSQEAKSLLKGEVGLEQYTPARVHNFKRKFKIVSRTGEPSRDKRAHYEKSWKMRGGERSKYWYPGDAGIPSVTIDYHFKTLVVYIDKGQTILARDIDEAEALGWSAIRKAKERFVQDQHLFKIDFVVEEVGSPLGKLEFGFLMKKSDPVIKEVIENDGNVDYLDHKVDNSPEEKMGPGYCEDETRLKPSATRLGRGIQIIEQIQPEAFKELGKIGEMSQTMMRVEALVQGGTTAEQRVAQLMGVIGSMLDTQNKLLSRIDALERGGHGGGGSPLSSASKGQQRLF